MTSDPPVSDQAFYEQMMAEMSQSPQLARPVLAPTKKTESGPSLTGYQDTWPAGAFTGDWREYVGRP